MVVCLEQGANLHMAQLMPLPLTVSCFSKIHIGFTFLVPAHPGSPGQRAVKWECVHACVRVRVSLSVPPEYSFQTVTKYNLPAWLAPLTLLIETISSSTLFSIRSICSETKTSSLSKAVAESVSSPAKTSAPVASSTTKLLFYSG